MATSNLSLSTHPDMSRLSFLHTKKHPVISNVIPTAFALEQKKHIIEMLQQNGPAVVIKKHWEEIVRFLDCYWYNKFGLMPHGDTSFVLLECTERLSVDRRAPLWCFYATQDVDDILVMLTGMDPEVTTCVGCVAYRQGYIYALATDRGTRWFWLRNSNGELKEIGVREADNLDEQRHSLTSFSVKDPKNATFKELVIPTMTVTHFRTKFRFRRRRGKSGEIAHLPLESFPDVLIEPLSYYFVPLAEDIVFLLARLKDRETHQHKRFDLFILRKSANSPEWVELDGDANEILPNSITHGLVSISHHPRLNVLFCALFDYDLSHLLLYAYDWKDATSWYKIGTYPLGTRNVKRNLVLYAYSMAIVGRFEERGMTRATLIVSPSLCFHFHETLMQDKWFTDTLIITTSVLDNCPVEEDIPALENSKIEIMGLHPVPLPQENL